MILFSAVMKPDIGLDILLSLDGTEYTEKNGYWYRIEAARVPCTPARPHGIRYNMTLHDHFNQRILGFDNAHAVKPSKGKRYAGRVITYDHVHHSIKDKGVPYTFVNAQQLLNDFLTAVNQIMSELGCVDNWLKDARSSPTYPALCGVSSQIAV